MMTRKDYQAIAVALKAELVEQRYRANGPKAVRGVAVRLAREFMADNPKFDPYKFYAACGIKG